MRRYHENGNIDMHHYSLHLGSGWRAWLFMPIERIEAALRRDALMPDPLPVELLRRTQAQSRTTVTP